MDEYMDEHIASAFELSVILMTRMNSENASVLFAVFKLEEEEREDAVTAVVEAAVVEVAAAAI